MFTYKFIFKGCPEILTVLAFRFSCLDRVVADEGLGSECRYLPAAFHTMLSKEEYEVLKAAHLVYENHTFDEENNLVVRAHGAMTNEFVDFINEHLGLGVFWHMHNASSDFKSGVLNPKEDVQSKVMDRLGLPYEVTTPPRLRYSLSAVEGLKRGWCGLAIHVPTRRFHVYSFAGDKDEFQFTDMLTGLDVLTNSATTRDEMVLLPHSIRLYDFICTTLFLKGVSEGEFPAFISALGNWVDTDLLLSAFRNLV